MGSLNFIDISGWQKGLDLEALFKANPSLDGVIVKSTGGASYVQPTCDPWVQTLIRMGKPWGFYHFMDDDHKASSGKTEAEFFVKNCRNYFGKGVPVADYEDPAKKHGTAYLKEFLDTVYSLTGVRAMVYTSLSVLYEQDFSKIAAAGYPLWVAQYANMKYTGIQETPWQNGAVSPFAKYWMHQYSSCGRLNGYNANLDLDKFYGSEEDWVSLAKGWPITEPMAPPAAAKKNISQEIIQDILDGKYSIGNERVQKLSAAGYDPTEVQSKINELYQRAAELKKLKSACGEYFALVQRISEN